MQCRCENVNSLPSQKGSNLEEFTPSGFHGNERMLCIYSNAADGLHVITGCYLCDVIDAEEPELTQYSLCCHSYCFYFKHIIFWRMKSCSLVFYCVKSCSQISWTHSIFVRKWLRAKNLQIWKYIISSHILCTHCTWNQYFSEMR